MPEAAPATAPVERGRPARERARAAATPFVVIYTRRSGSNWVSDMLSSHPDVVCDGELFAPTGTAVGHQPLPTDVPYLFDTLPRRARKASPRALLGPGFAHPLKGWRYANTVFDPGRAAGAVGCKVSYAHFKHVPWLLAYIVVKNVPIIHLVRRNKLDHLLSIATTRARSDNRQAGGPSRYHALENQRAENPTVELNTRTLVRDLAREERRLRRARRLVSLLRVPTSEVAYEDLLSDPDRFDDILRFLGVDPSEAGLRSRLQKWNRGGQRTAIANYDAVCATLRGTRFEHFLES
jgi:hypothetical protein